MADSYFVYFQPNPKENKTTDCTIRAICATTGLSWYEVFDKVVLLARKECYFPDDGSFTEKRLALFGFEKRVIPRPKKGYKSITVQQFCKEHPTGKYILSTAHHNIGVVDGKYYDTFVDYGSKVYTYYEYVETKKENIPEEVRLNKIKNIVEEAISKRPRSDNRIFEEILNLI